MNIWFECKVKYTKILDNGREANVTESFMLEAISFTDAETRIIWHMRQIVKGEFAVTDIRKSKIMEIFRYDEGEWWFRAVINLVTIDEEQGKEKKIKANYLVLADDIKQALNRLDESLSYLVIPFVVSSISVSQVADVFHYNPSEIILPPGFKPLDATE